jgi:4-amino-4-deoxy-L-arabinose transferase-like glycosyltransferase
MSARITNILVVFVLVILSLAILGNSMTKPVGRDEQMYCTGAVLMAQGKMIYRDFSYASQMPYHPLLCAALFKVSGTTHYLLVGRLVSCVCDIFVMLCIVGIYRCVFKSATVAGTLLGLAAVVLWLFNPLVDYANGYAWNHDVVILCIVLSFWLFISTDFGKKNKHWRIAAIGALLTFVTCMRITTALLELLFLVVLLSSPAESMKQRLKTALPFLLAAALVLIWPIWVIAQAPRAFFLNMVKIPMLYGKWLHEIRMVHDKLQLTLACLSTPGYFVLVALTIYLCLTIVFLRRRLRITNTGSLLLAALLPVAFLVIALIPPTMWRQYLAAPVPFMVISLALPLSHLRDLTGKGRLSRHFIVAVTIVAICGLLAVVSYPFVLHRVPMAIVPETWEPIELHKVSQDIAAKAKEPKLILTLSPLLALEGGGRIYPELSAGAIIYRTADSLSSDERRLTHTAGQKTLAEVLNENPPSAVILGIERGRLTFLEAPLQATVMADWERKNYEYGPTVYFAP